MIEDGKSFQENALKKAREIAQFTGEIALADDSGLEVDALGGRPGIYSSRFAGEDADDERNIEKVLELLKNTPEEKRTASFRCVLVLCDPAGGYKAFEGKWNGRISEIRQGDSGFGYDPIFYLPEAGKTVAELSTEEKNRRSHRAQALQALKEYLRKNPIHDRKQR